MYIPTCNKRNEDPIVISNYWKKAPRHANAKICILEIFEDFHSINLIFRKEYLSTY